MFSVMGIFRPAPEAILEGNRLLLDAVDNGLSKVPGESNLYMMRVRGAGKTDFGIE
jgi:hypothetical protein